VEQKMKVELEFEQNGFSVRVISWEGFFIETIKSARAPTDGDFLPARVIRNDVEWWSFKNDHRGYRGLGKLVELGDELVIALGTRDWLHAVLPVRDLPQMQKTPAGEFVGGRGIKELMAVKCHVAEELGLSPSWTEREMTMQQALTTAAREQRAEEEKRLREESIRKHEERLRARSEARAEIVRRKRLHVFTTSGDRRHGVPVVGDEWLSLSTDTFCVSVTSYDVATGAVGEPIESFVVLKRGSKVSRGAVASVKAENPVKRNASLSLDSLTFHAIAIKGEIEEVVMLPSMEAIRELREKGLNSGTLAMCPKEGDTGKYSVFRLTKGTIEAVTEVTRHKAK